MPRPNSSDLATFTMKHYLLVCAALLCLSCTRRPSTDEARPDETPGTRKSASARKFDRVEILVTGRRAVSTYVVDDGDTIDEIVSWFPDDQPDAHPDITIPWKGRHTLWFFRADDVEPALKIFLTDHECYWSKGHGPDFALKPEVMPGLLRIIAKSARRLPTTADEKSSP
jgi:hypothetical protein